MVFLIKGVGSDADGVALPLGVRRVDVKVAVLQNAYHAVLGAAGLRAQRAALQYLAQVVAKRRVMAAQDAGCRERRRIVSPAAGDDPGAAPEGNQDRLSAHLGNHAVCSVEGIFAQVRHVGGHFADGACLLPRQDIVFVDVSPDDRLQGLPGKLQQDLVNDA